MLPRHVITIIRLFVLKVVLPTIDTYGDIYFAAKAFHTEHYAIAGFMIVSPFLNFVFTFLVWMKCDFDTIKEK